MAIFDSGVSPTNLGYKLLFSGSHYDSSANPQKNEEFKKFQTVATSSDPRGVFPYGMIPSKQFSYRMVASYEDFSTDNNEALAMLASFISPIGGGAAAIIAMATPLPDLVLSSHLTMTAVLVFEGRDVIDLPTIGLKTIVLPKEEGGGIAFVVPDKVARPLYASANPWIKPGDSIAKSAALAYGSNDPDNLLLGMAISPEATQDERKMQGIMGRSFCDSASYGIRAKPGAKYLSYVAMDQPLFRDVIISQTSTMLGGFTTIAGGFQVIDTSFIQTGKSWFMRFAFMNLAKPNETPRFNWRLAESMGVPTTGKLDKAPDALVKAASAEDRQRNLIDEQTLHIAYDLNDSAVDLTKFPFKPAKNGVAPLLAKAKSQTGTYQDKNFKAQVLDYALPGTALFAPFSATDQYWVLFKGSYPIPSFGYTSPMWQVKMSSSARALMEYSVYRPFQHNELTELSIGGVPFPRASLYGKTTEQKSGLAAVNDCCQLTTNLFDVTESSVGPMIVERLFDDMRWQRGAIIPSSQTNKFMGGEYPFRSDGMPILVPTQTKIETKITGESVSIPAGKIPTNLLLGVADNADSTLQLFSSHNSKGQTPIFEMSLKPIASSSIAPQNATVLAPLPAMSFGAFRPGGLLTLKEVFGVDKSQKLLDPIGGDKNSKDPSEAQLAFVNEQDFPVQASNISACSFCTAGNVFLGFENEGRVDMAIRSNCNEPFAMLRDVTLRIPDNKAMASAVKAPVPDKTKTGNAAAKQSQAQAQAQNMVKKKSSDFPLSSLPILLQDIGNDTKHVFLFYAYKQKLLVKDIPLEILAEKLNDNGLYDAATEKKIVQKMHKLGADLVYGNNSGITTDIQAGAIRIGSGSLSASPQNVVQHSAYIDNTGGMIAFVQTEKQIVTRKSTDLGKTWSDALSDGFMFIPKVPLAAGSHASHELDGEMPVCMCDDSTYDVFLFMVFQGSLIYFKFPAELLRKPPADAATALKQTLQPKLIFGPLTKEMFDRGIRPVEVEGRSKEADQPSVLVQRVAVIKTVEGYYRVFFRDVQENLRSLISYDVGVTWKVIDQIDQVAKKTT